MKIIEPSEVECKKTTTRIKQHTENGLEAN